MEREIKSPILFHAFKSLHYFVIKYKRTAEPPPAVAVAEDRTTRYSCIPNTQKDRKITGRGHTDRWRCHWLAAWWWWWWEGGVMIIQGTVSSGSFSPFDRQNDTKGPPAPPGGINIYELRGALVFPEDLTTTLRPPRPFGDTPRERTTRGRIMENT